MSDTARRLQNKPSGLNEGNEASETIIFVLITTVFFGPRNGFLRRTHVLVFPPDNIVGNALFNQPELQALEVLIVEGHHSAFLGAVRDGILPIPR